jgi:hypothetical protein
MRFGKHGEGVSADLVGSIPVGGNPVRPDEDLADFPMLSVIRVAGMFSFINSQAVSRAP